jgi:hypothetical protein
MGNYVMRCCVSFKRTAKMPKNHLAGHSRERALSPRPTLPLDNCMRLGSGSRIILAA